MKTNKFNSSNSLLAVAVILLVGGVGIGTYYGINETNEINYLKNKSNTILTALNNRTTFDKNIYLVEDGFKVNDLHTFEQDLHRVLKDSPIIHTYFEPEQINGDTLYLYNDKEDNDSTFSNIRLYSYKSSKYIDINVISKSSYIKTYNIEINLPTRLELQHTSLSYQHDGYLMTIRNSFFIYDKDNKYLSGFNSYINIEQIKGNGFAYEITGNTIYFTEYYNGESEFKVSITDFPDIEPVTFTLSVKTVIFTPEK